MKDIKLQCDMYGGHCTQKRVLVHWEFGSMLWISMLLI